MAPNARALGVLVVRSVSRTYDPNSNLKSAKLGAGRPVTMVLGLSRFDTPS